MIATDFLKHLNRMQLLIDKRVSSNYLGERKSIHTGRGTVFQDRSMYAPGDDYRDIDWQVYARTDKLHTKRYEEDKSLTTHIIIDASKSMDFGSGDVNKFDYASMIGLAFAHMALKRNEKFVLSTFSDSLERFKAHKGRQQFLAALEHLKKTKAAGKSKFEHSLAQYAKSIDTRSLIVVISDFLYDIDEVQRSLGRFKNCEIKLIQVLDETEEKLNVEGDIKVKDLESSDVMRTFINKVTRANYFKKKQEHTARLKHLSGKLGAKFYNCNTSTDIFDSLFMILAH